MAFVKKLIPFKGKKKQTEVVGESSKLPKTIIAKIKGHHLEGSKHGGLSMEGDKTGGLLKEAEKTAGLPMEDKKTAGVPKKTVGVPTETKKTAGVPTEAKKTASPPMEGEKTAGLPIEDNKTAGVSIDDNKTAGVSIDDNKTAGVSIDDNKTAGLPIEDNKTAGLPIEDNKTAGLPIEDNKTAGLPMEDNKTAGLPIEDNKTAGLPMEDNKTAGLPIEVTKTSGLPMEDNKTAGLPIEDNKTVGLPIEDNKTAGLPMEDNKTADLPMEVIHETELACFALGCFWFPESQFGCAPGVLKTRVGYTGGNATGPTHYNLEDHMEAVEITFDPKVTDYSCMLNLFWENHDPTRTESSHQHVSTIFYHSDTQMKLAEETSIIRQEKLVKDILTKIMKAETFYTAERSHQKYLLRQQRHIMERLRFSDTDLITSNIACRINGFCGGNGTLEQLEGELPSFALEPEVEEYLRKIVSYGPLH